MWWDFFNDSTILLGMALFGGVVIIEFIQKRKK